MNADGEQNYHRLEGQSRWLKPGTPTDSAQDYVPSEDSVMTGCSSVRMMYANREANKGAQFLNRGLSPSPNILGTTDPFTSPFAIPPPPLHKVSVFSSPHHRETFASYEEGSPMCNVFGNFINAVVGAGIVGLPHTFKQGGVIPALLSMILMAMLSDYSLRLLVKTARYAKVKTYEDLCEYCFGNKGFYFVSTAMFFFDFGAMLAFLIIMGDSAEKLVLVWTGHEGDNIRRLVIVLIASVVIFPLALLRDISKLENFSALSVLTVFLISAIVVYKLADVGLKNKDEAIVYASMGFPSAFGTIAFAFVCQDVAFMMFNSLARPSTKRWGKLVHLSMGTACIICISFGLCGYLTFRGNVSTNLLNDYADDEAIVQVARVIYVLSMALTYPMSFYVTRHVIYTIIFRGPEYKSEKECSTRTHLAISIPLFLATVGVVMVVTDLGVVLSLTGSVAAVFLAFLLPAACHLKAQPSPLQFWLYHEGAWKGFKFVAPSMFLVVFGVTVLILSTAQTIAEQMHYELFG